MRPFKRCRGGTKMMESSDLETVDLEESDFIFEKPERVIVSGSSNSGKTYLVEQLVKKHTDKFYKIVICGNRNRLLDFPETACKTSLHKSDGDPIYNPFTEINSYELKLNKKKQFLLILDDLMEVVYQSAIVSKIFSAGRHFQISCIILCQSFFPSGSGRNIYPQIKNNSSIFIFTKLRSKNQIGNISRHLEDDRKSQKFFVELYKKIVQAKKYGYLAVLLDAPEQLRYATNLTNEDNSGYLTVHTP